MIGIMVPETHRASNKICDKYHLLHLVGILFPHINDDARSESLQIQIYAGFYLTVVRCRRLDTEAVSDEWLDVAVHM